MRLLPVGPDHVGGGAARQHAQSRRFRHRCGDGGQHLPLRHLCAHPRGDQAAPRRSASHRSRSMAIAHEIPGNFHAARC